VMRDGSIVEAGDTEKVLNRPENAYARKLVSAIPRIDVSAPPESGEDAPVALKINQLSFTYPKPRQLFGRRISSEPALEGIDLKIKQGETLGVVGESGSGKSTLAALIAGATAGHQGTIQLGTSAVSGHAIDRPADMRRRIQLVFQDPLSALNPTQTIGEILSRPLRLYYKLTEAEARQKVSTLMVEMGMSPDLATRRPRQLSGGQQQRVGLARALAARPELVICDEVTSALDVTIQEQVLSLFLRLQQELGLTSIFISHDLAVIARVSHQIAVLEKGVLREVGPRDDILNAPRHPYTRMLLDAVGHGPGPSVSEPYSQQIQAEIQPVTETTGIF